MESSLLGESRNYQVLARRTRPQSMGDLIGQPVVLRALSSVIESGQLPHAFLLTGTRGTGKTSTARILAKSLCCEKGPTLSPCQVCDHCVQITASAHEDVLEIDGASHTGVDNVRELRESARFFPKTGRFKIFVIDEVHMLSTGAFNALLKTLEEPPPRVIFILATTELNKVPVTVRSRCFPLVFRKIETETIAAHLGNILAQEALQAEPGALQLVAREARGSLRDSLSLLEQVLAFNGRTAPLTIAGVKEALALQGEQLAEQIFAAVCSRDEAAALAALREADTACLDLPTILDQSAAAFRSALLLRGVPEKRTRERLVDRLPQEIEELEFRAQGLSTAALSELFRLFAQAARDAARASAPLAWAEVAVLDAISRSEWLSASELLQRISGDGPSPKSGVPGPAGRAPGGSQAPAGISETRAPAGVGLPASAETPAESRPLVKSAGSQGPAIEIDAWARFLDLVHGRHPGLATRLKHAKILAFNPQSLEFSGDPDNELYAIASASDAKLLQETLTDFGFPSAKVHGLRTDSSGGRTAPARPRPSPGPVRSEANSSAILGSSPTPRLDDLIKMDAFGSRNPVRPPEQASEASLAQLERKRRDEELKRQEASLRSLESVRRLSTIAEVEFEALED